MIRDILGGLTTGGQRPGQIVGQIPQMPMMLPMPQQQPQQLDPYGQQTSGLKAALMGRFINGFRL